MADETPPEPPNSGDEKPSARSPEEIRALGEKVAAEARAMAEALDAVPFMPVYDQEPVSDFDPEAFDRAADEIASAKAEQRSKAAKPKKPHRKRARQRDTANELIDDIGYGRTATGEVFVVLKVADHFENWRLQSRWVRSYFSHQFSLRFGFTPTAQAIEDLLRAIEGRANFDGQIIEGELRVHGDGDAIYIDLVDSEWRAVKITRSECALSTGERLPFFRTPRSATLSLFEPGESIDRLRNFVNCATEDDFILLVGFLLVAIVPASEYPILVISGEQGSGKTWLCRIIRDLVDPSVVDVELTPREERNLYAAVSAAHLLIFDNVSVLPPWLSDISCAIATGSALPWRTMGSNLEETIVRAKRPQVYAGIPDFADRADFASRALFVRSKVLARSERRPKSEIGAEWKAAAPWVLGALYAAVSTGLRDLATTTLSEYSRMADFERWVTACESGLGWVPGTFSAAYARNQKNSSDTVFESDVVAMAVRDFVECSKLTYWEGTATQLLHEINNVVSETTKSLRSWPKTNQGLGNAIARSAPLLRERGIAIDKRHSGDRKIIISRAPPSP